MFDKDTLNRFYRYCLSLTHAPDTAYDLLQSSLEKVLRRQKARQDRSDELPPLGYLYAIARNAFIDGQRHRTRFPSEPLDEETTGGGAVSSVGFSALEDLMLDRSTVVSLMSQLEASERELLYLWAVEGYTIQEIAEHMHTPRGTLLSRLHRLRARIQRAIAPAFDTPRLKEVAS